MAYKGPLIPLIPQQLSEFVVWERTFCGMHLVPYYCRGCSNGWRVCLLFLGNGKKERLRDHLSFFFRCLGNTTSLCHSPRVLYCVVLCCVVLVPKKVKICSRLFSSTTQEQMLGVASEWMCWYANFFFLFLSFTQACMYATPLRLRCNMEHSKPRPSLLMIGLLLVRLCLSNSLLNRSWAEAKAGWGSRAHSKYLLENTPTYSAMPSFIVVIFLRLLQE